MAMAAFAEAIAPDTAQSRKDEIERQLRAYCALDTYGLVRLWQIFSARQDLEISSYGKVLASGGVMRRGEVIELGASSLIMGCG